MPKFIAMHDVDPGFKSIASVETWIDKQSEPEKWSVVMVRPTGLRQGSSENPLDVQIGGGHYKNCPIQPVEYCQKNGLGFCESSVVKYVTRHKEKNGRQDIEKAIHFLNLLLELEYGDIK